MPVLNERVELSTVQLQSFTRLGAFTCKIPPTRTPKNVTTKRHFSPYPVETPCKHRCIPPEATLSAWKAELQKVNRLSTSSYSVECEFGSYNLSIVDAAMQLHTARAIRAMVEQEIDWFAESFKNPASVQAIPSRTALNAFRSLIHNNRYSQILRDFEMDPQELSRLCCNRYLAGDHMKWIAKQLNAQQKEVLCVYANSVFSVGNFVRRLNVDDKSPPKRIGIILNVGKRRHVNNGNEEWEVFMGAMGREGNHFSTAIVDTESNTITYGDSLGWGVPKTLLTFIRRLYVQIFKRQMPEMQMNVCHPTPDSCAFHECSSRCASLYPLQQNGTVCGVVAIVVLAIACLAPRYYSVLTDKMLRGANHLPSLFISRPHTYAKYLRRVIMTWFSERCISIQYITPTSLLGLEMGNTNNVDALKDIEPEEEEDVVLVDFESDEEVPTMPIQNPTLERRLRTRVCIQPLLKARLAARKRPKC